MKEIRLGDLYRAYRKAKTEAFFEKGHFSSIAFATYEKNLEDNLKRLLRALHSGDAWTRRRKFLGEYTYVPKSIESPQQDQVRDIHFATLDPIEDWKRTCIGGKKLKASFRPVIIPTIDYQIISALWIIKVGHKFDEIIDRKLSYAHRLKRKGANGPLNLDSYQLFAPYFSGYRTWRSRGLTSMRKALNEGRAIVAVTMDIQSFYHSVSPNFLLRSSFLKKNHIRLSAFDTQFTRLLLQSISTWYATTPEYKRRHAGALPVGLSASKIISNVLLAEFDRVISRNPNTVHYGRYADDIFLVTIAEQKVSNGESYIRWLRKQFHEYFVLDRENGTSGLRLKLTYAFDSDIVFSSKKQKIFFLSGIHGLDLIGQVEEKIRCQSSEYRLLPELPIQEAAMLDLALLASPDARLEADALRKAEAVSLRRLGFSFLLGDFEAYARDLNYDDYDWKTARDIFYGIVNRYVITPSGYFDYFTYIIRVFGLMIACRDYAAARKLLKCLAAVRAVLTSTTTCGSSDRAAFLASERSYYRGFLQVSLESATVSNFVASSPRYLALLKQIVGKLRAKVYGSRSHVLHMIREFLISDLGRRGYQDYWYHENRRESEQPEIPEAFSIRKSLYWVRRFRGKAKKTLVEPYWPAIAFPTRPPMPWQISLSVPRVLSEKGELERAMWAVRGGYVNPRYADYSFAGKDEAGRDVWKVPGEQGLRVGLALPSFEVTPEQWEGAIKGSPDHSLSRYLAVRRLINEMLKCADDINYIVFPELSLPYRWALDIASRLAKRGISFIAGLETRGRRKEYRNEVLVSLVSDFYGKRSNVCFIQPKIALSHDEKFEIESRGRKFEGTKNVNSRRPIYLHGELAFGVLVCSDLTAIQNRVHFQGAVDLLFVVEWNKDVDTFDFLVESAAHDLHAAIVQVNNRMYGDSRVRIPFTAPYKRDVVKVKGGTRDFFVCCSFDAEDLRRFQALRFLPDHSPHPTRKYKPTPIGYKRSSHRRRR